MVMREAVRRNRRGTVGADGRVAESGAHINHIRTCGDNGEGAPNFQFRRGQDFSCRQAHGMSARLGLKAYFAADFAPEYGHEYGKHVCKHATIPSYGCSALLPRPSNHGNRSLEDLNCSLLLLRPELGLCTPHNVIGNFKAHFLHASSLSLARS